MTLKLVPITYGERQETHVGVHGVHFYPNKIVFAANGGMHTLDYDREKHVVVIYE